MATSETGKWPVREEAILDRWTPSEAPTDEMPTVEIKSVGKPSSGGTDTLKHKGAEPILKYDGLKIVDPKPVKRVQTEEEKKQEERWHVGNLWAGVLLGLIPLVSIALHVVRNLDGYSRPLLAGWQPGSGVWVALALLIFIVACLRAASAGKNFFAAFFMILFGVIMTPILIVLGITSPVWGPALFVIIMVGGMIIAPFTKYGFRDPFI